MSLLELRAKYGLSRVRLGLMLGVTPSFISSVESGQRSLSLPLICRLASLLGEDIYDALEAGGNLPRHIVVELRRISKN